MIGTQGEFIGFDRDLEELWFLLGCIHPLRSHQDADLREKLLDDCRTLMVEMYGRWKKTPLGHSPEWIRRMDVLNIGAAEYLRLANRHRRQRARAIQRKRRQSR
jgi:hypothetical protein